MKSEQTAKRLVNALSGPGWGNLDDTQRSKVVQVVDSAISKAVREERERCCRAICKRCATGDVPSPTQTGVWVHQYALGVSDGMQDCDAVELRKEPDHD